MLETTATRDDLATATGGVSDEVAQLREAVNDARAQLGLLEAELEERARGQVRAQWGCHHRIHAQPQRHPQMLAQGVTWCRHPQPPTRGASVGP